MRLVFIDEVEQHQKKRGFFGVGSLVVDSVHYSALRKGVESALSEASLSRLGLVLTLSPSQSGS